MLGVRVMKQRPFFVVYFVAHVFSHSETQVRRSSKRGVMTLQVFSRLCSFALLALLSGYGLCKPISSKLFYRPPQALFDDGINGTN